MGFLNGVPFMLSILTILLLMDLPAGATLTKRSVNIIHMDKSLMPKAFSSHQNWYSSTVADLRYANSTPSTSFLIYTYDTAIHGFSAILSLKELETLKRCRGFVRAQSDAFYTYHSTSTPEFLNLNPATGLWPFSNYGKDVIIGFIDSGVWPENPSFKDTGMATDIAKKWKGKCDGGENFNSSLCNNKLIGVRYFNGGLVEKEKTGLIQGKNSARDMLGHGTFVCSIAAGNFVPQLSYFGYAKGTTKGIAPRTRLAMHKVFWNEEFVSSDVLAAIDQAINDGVDVICASFGSLDSVLLHKNALAIASLIAMEEGILVVCSAGNVGPHFGRIENGFPWVLTVAAGTTNRWFAGVLTLGNGVKITGWSLFTGNTTLQNLPLLYNNLLSKCQSQRSLLNAPYGIIICKEVRFPSQLLEILTKANIRGAILITENPASSFLYGPLDCPCIVISSKDAKPMINHVEYDSNPRGSIIFQNTIIGIHSAPAVAAYSSRGPSRSYKYISKPDVLALGSFILGAWNPKVEASRMGLNMPLYQDYAVKSGTSVACSVVAGVAALLKAKHPEWSPSAIGSAIMTTVNPFDSSLKPIKDDDFLAEFASPLAMGSGVIDPNSALGPGLIYNAIVRIMLFGSHLSYNFPI